MTDKTIEHPQPSSPTPSSSCSTIRPTTLPCEQCKTQYLSGVQEGFRQVLVQASKDQEKAFATGQAFGEGQGYKAGLKEGREGSWLKAKREYERGDKEGYQRGSREVVERLKRVRKAEVESVRVLAEREGFEKGKREGYEWRREETERGYKRGRKDVEEIQRKVERECMIQGEEEGFKQGKLEGRNVLPSKREQWLHEGLNNHQSNVALKKLPLGFGYAPSSLEELQSPWRRI